jgi:peptidoglycan/LPS O-acetylase OafA/YrhL
MQIGGLHLFCGAVLVIAIAFAAAICLGHLGFFRSAIEGEVSSNRFHAIDGLRGYLALGVLLHHFVINQQFYRTGSWELTPSRLNTFLGRGSVAFFFMITAFLFWRRAIEGDGRIDTLKLYVSRFRRLVPMYLVSAGLLIVTALALTHFRLSTGLVDLVSQITSWLLFTIPGLPDINGLKQTSLINTVFWSLVYEWRFYLILPFAAAIAAVSRAWVVALGAGLCIALFSPTQIEWFFVGGCVAAHFVRLKTVRDLSAGPIGSVVALACIVVTALYQPITYSPLGAALLFVPFLIFAAGNSLFGLLTCRPARLLGLLSYGLYLLHNWVLYLVSRMVNHYTAVAGLSPAHYWALAVPVVLVTVGLSALTYRFVEYPWIGGAGKENPLRR